VQTTHFRYIADGQTRLLMPMGMIRALGLTAWLLPQGGFTRVRIPGPYEGTYLEGWSRCSDRDNFNRRLGRTIALGRAKTRLYRTGAPIERVTPRELVVGALMIEASS
jgi:hypothetical protein